MIPLQILSVLFGFFMLYWVRTHYIRKHMESFEYGIWTTVWALFIFAAIFPQTFQGITESLNIARVFDLLVIIALMVITFVSFQNRIHYKRLEKKLEESMRKKAIDAKTTPSKN